LALGPRFGDRNVAHGALPNEREGTGELGAHRAVARARGGAFPAFM